MIARVTAPGRMLRREPVAPTAVAALLERHETFLAFRQLVRLVLPEAEAEILNAHSEGGDRERARVWAFLHRVEAEHFPVYELDEYDQVLYGIPFVRHAWSHEQFHDLDRRPGELLLFALCAQPYADGHDTRVALLDAAETLVPKALLQQIPPDGFTPAELHQRLDGTPLAAAAEFADWLWAETGSIFLDLDDEIDASIDWAPENLRELAEDWRRAQAILDRIELLATCLEGDPPARFAQFLDAVLTQGVQDTSTSDEHTRRFDSSDSDEGTTGGLTPVSPDEPGPLPLPADPPG